MKENTLINRLDLLTALSKGATVFTVNNRLKNTLAQEYTEQQTGIIWETANIYTTSSWVATIIEEGCFQGLIPMSNLPHKILDPLAQQLLFTQIIKQHEQENNPLLSFNELAKYASNAWQSIRLYQINSHSDDFFISTEFKHFKKWQEAYIKQCHQQKACDEIDLLKTLVTHIEPLRPLLPKEVYCAGFDQTNPLLEQLFTKLNTIRLVDKQDTLSIGKISYSSLETEIKSAAVWAQNIHQKDPLAKIGILVPELEKNQQLIKDLFKETLYPEQSGLDTKDYQPIHNLSLGQPLYSFALISDAVNFLELISNTEKTDYTIFSAFNRSPYWSKTENDIHQRTAFDRYFCEHTGLKLNFKNYTQCLAKFYAEQADVTLPEWAHLLINIQQPFQSKKSLSEWADYFSTVLNNISYTNFNCSSLNEQLLHAFKKSLGQMSHYDFICAKVTAAYACSLLKQITNQQTFQFKTEDNAPIQLMGLLESAGQKFDYIWLMQANNQNLPASANPNPILPIEIQTKYKLPRSSSQHELSFARTLLKRIINTAQTIVFSFSEHDDSGMTYLESGLISDFPPLDLSLKLSSSKSRMISLEAIKDTKGIRLPTPYPLKKAASFLKAQALCPLMAYAQFRLKATEMPTPKIRLDYLERGILVHHILEKNITQVPLAKQKLLIEKLLQQHATKNQWPKKIMELETLRVQNLLSDWNQTIEQYRLDFTTQGLELYLEGTLSGLHFNLRLDRIDKTSKGALLIDYKTGSSASTLGWFDERLTEPQMPLYASIMAKQQAVSGITLGKVVAEKPSMPGVGVEPWLDKKSRTKPLSDEEWHAQLELWQSKLEILANEIINAEATLLLDNKAAIYNSPAVGFCRIYDYV